MAPHISVLAWRISMDRGARGLQSMGSQRVGHSGATEHDTLLSFICFLDFSLSLIHLLNKCFLITYCMQSGFRYWGFRSERQRCWNHQGLIAKRMETHEKEVPEYLEYPG